MPYLFATEAKYDAGKYILYDPRDLMSNFPFLDEKVIVGKFISAYKDGKIIRINKEFKAQIKRCGNYYVAELLESNPLKTVGLPLPLPVLIVVHRYEEEGEQGKVEYPIVEGILLRGSGYSYFEDEIKRVFKEEELSILIEGTIFHLKLQRLESTMKEALISFEQENFAYTKTSCRKILERIKQIVGEWKTIDNSESLCEKLKSVVNSLYSFASIGGPHEGVTTREETELILKNTTSLLFYINSLLKNQRISCQPL